MCTSLPMKIHCILVLLFAGLACKAQVEEVVQLPDTFHFHAVENVRFVTTLDSVGTIMDVLQDPQAYVLRVTNAWYGDLYAMAIPRAGGYLVFDPISGSHADGITVEATDLDGSGSKELIVRWMNYRGHTGWENSIHERERQVRIWNVDSLTCMFEFTYYNSMQGWWTLYAPDSTGIMPYEEREVLGSGGEEVCETFDVTIADHGLGIRRTNDCSDQYDGSIPLIGEPTVYYRLTPYGLVRRSDRNGPMGR